MKVKKTIDNSLELDEIVISYNEENSLIETICKYVKDVGKVINVYEEDKVRQILLKDVFYFDSVDGKTFAYTESDVFLFELKLYEIEEELNREKFVRINKSCIVNFNKLRYVKRISNGRLNITMKNEEQLIVNRSYMKAFKERFGL